jgi:hypothetical protein
MEPVRSIFGHWLQRRTANRQKPAPAPLRAAPSPPLSDERRRRLEEARALVEDVFGQPERK